MSVKFSLASEPWLFRQLSNLQHRHPEMVNPILDKLLSEDEAVRWALVVNAYLDEQINLGKAAELLDLPEVVLRKRFVEMGIPVRQGVANVEEAKAEADAIRVWFTEK